APRRERAVPLPADGASGRRSGAPPGRGDVPRAPAAGREERRGAPGARRAGAARPARQADDRARALGGDGTRARRARRHARPRDRARSRPLRAQQADRAVARERAGGRPGRHRARAGGARRMSGALTGQVALVTGGSRGIGRAVALRLAAAGATVVVNYRENAPAAEETVRLIAAAGGRASAACFDVGDAEAVRVGVQHIVDAAAKAGVIGFTKSLAREVAARGVTVNAVAPGLVETDMTAGLDDQQRGFYTNVIPAGRIATPEEISAAVAFLASPEAGYITGQVLHVNGGLYM